MISAVAGQGFEATLRNAPPGLTTVMGVRILDNAGGTTLPRTTAGIVEYPIGSGFYQVTLTAPMAEGQYTVMWDSDPGGVASPSNSASEDLIVSLILEASLDAGGPCEAWITGADLAERSSLSGADLADLDVAASWAGQLLYGLSGRIFSGRCRKTVRPCRPSCECWSVGPGSWPGYWWGWTGGSWGGYPGGAFWGGLGGDALTRCGCGVLRRVRLPYPTRKIMSVTIDGDLIPESDYRLDSNKWLTQMHNPSVPWPACQDLSLPSGASGTFEIDLVWGSRPPLAGIQAALALGEQLYRLNTTGDCDIPANATQLIRQGTTISIQELFRQNPDRSITIGIPAVDAFLATYNPRNHRRRPALWSPDVQQTARKVGQ